MKVRLRTDIVGNSFGSTENQRIHAIKGDILPVIFRNKTHFICDSLRYPGMYIPVFLSQCDEVIPEKVEVDEHAEEKYYNVYDANSNLKLENDLSNTELVDEYDE